MRKIAEAKEMAPQLRALALLLEDSGSVSQQPYGNSELSVSLVPGDLAPSHRNKCRQKSTNAHEIKIN
jgi:hypothetical protein